MDTDRTDTGELNNTVYRLQHVRKVYKSRGMGKKVKEIPGLNGISMEIKAGEFLAIMGPSGSGKSTLLHLLGGLDIPTSGDVFITPAVPAKMPLNPGKNSLNKSSPGEKPPITSLKTPKVSFYKSLRYFFSFRNWEKISRGFLSSNGASQGKNSSREIRLNKLNEGARARLRRSNIGVIYQAFHLVPTLCAWENAALPLVFAGIPFARRKEKAQKLLADLKLENRLYHYPNELSGGEQQRVAIARALISAPSIILADEPTGNLDKKSEKDILDILRNLHLEHHLTIVLVTHNEKIAQEAERKIYLEDGLITADDINWKQ